MQKRIRKKRRSDSSNYSVTRESKSGATAEELAGFVGYNTVIVGTVVYFALTLVPDEMLREYTHTDYFPAKEWAITLPGFLLFTVLCAIAAYGFIALSRTPPVDALCAVTDDFSHSNDALCVDSASDTPAFCDIPLSQTTTAILNDVLSSDAE